MIPMVEALYYQKPAGLVVRKWRGRRYLRRLSRWVLFYQAENAPRVEREASNSGWIMSKERMEYRHTKIIEILDDMIHRLPKETFDKFLERAYTTANLALNRANKAITDDECPDITDRWVMRFEGFQVDLQVHGRRLEDGGGGPALHAGSRGVRHAHQAGRPVHRLTQERAGDQAGVDARDGRFPFN